MVARRGTFGRIAFLGGAVLAFGGFLYAMLNFGSRDVTVNLTAWAGMLAGYTLLALGKGAWQRFSVRPRPHESLVSNLRTLDARHTLFNYISALGVDHLLSTPYGLIVVNSQPLFGDVRVRGSRWSRRQGMAGFLQRFTQGSIGNPTSEVLRDVETVRQHLSTHLGEDAARVPIQPLIVVTHPRAILDVEDPDVPVVHVRDVRGEVRRISGTDRLPADLARRIDALLLGEASEEGTPVNAGDAVERRTRRRATKAR